MDKYFMHRVKEENGVFTAGVEVHDTLESAIRSFHGYMKQGYDNPSFPNVTFVSCKVRNGSGETLTGYDETWQKEDEYAVNAFFLHHIRMDGETFTKAIDVLTSYETAEHRFHAEMEYGYENTKFPNVKYESCLITEKLSNVELKKETWEKPSPEPEPETEEEPAEAQA